MSPGKLLLLACTAQDSLVWWRLVRSALVTALSGCRCPLQPRADCLPLPLVRSSLSALEDICSPLVDWWSDLQATSTGQAGKATRVIHPFISKGLSNWTWCGIACIRKNCYIPFNLYETLSKAAAVQAERHWILRLCFFFFFLRPGPLIHVQTLKVVMAFLVFHVQKWRQIKW